MKLFTIFGNPVSHSRSPLMHNNVFKTLGIDAAYIRTCLDDGQQIKNTFIRLGLKGANVTVPFKEDAFSLCDEVRGIAQEIKAVNTLVLENNKLIGYNTDAPGFIKAAQNFMPFKTVLILGAGGTAKAIANEFKNQGYDVSILNRSEQRLQYFHEKGFTAYSWQNFKIQHYDLVVNTTSAGLEDASLPLEKELLSTLLKNAKACMDVVYGKETPFLALAKNFGLAFKDGSDMLLYQGAIASEYFLEHEKSFEEILKPMQESFSF